MSIAAGRMKGLEYSTSMQTGKLVYDDDLKRCQVYQQIPKRFSRGCKHGQMWRRGAYREVQCFRSAGCWPRIAGGQVEATRA